jgi:predicted ATP-grasp superfamily ATP-dependent carboligase
VAVGQETRVRVLPRPGRSRLNGRGPSTRAVGGIVVGGDFVGLGIVRSLGRRGVPVCVIDDERSISRFSRYTTYAVRVPTLRDENRVTAALLEAADRLRLDGWVLYPTRDEVVGALARNRSTLERRFRVGTDGWSSVRWAWDKRNTHRLAEELGIPAPKTWYVRDARELDTLHDALPVAIKPAIKEHFIYATKVKAWRADTVAELTERFEQASAIVGSAEVMIQELIPGDGREQFAYCAFFKEGRSLGSMVVRRRRQHPPEFGRASTFVETVDLPVLDELSERLLRAIDYYGLVELEYKRDSRTGEFKLLDFNARTWGYHTLGQRAGVDFPYMLYADLVGESVEPCRAKPDVRWIRLVTDLPTGALEVFRGRTHWRSYLRSLRSADIESVFSRDDPLPGIVELGLVPYLIVKRGY